MKYSLVIGTAWDPDSRSLSLLAPKLSFAEARELSLLAYVVVWDWIGYPPIRLDIIDATPTRKRRLLYRRERHEPGAPSRLPGPLDVVEFVWPIQWKIDCSGSLDFVLAQQERDTWSPMGPSVPIVVTDD